MQAKSELHSPHPIGYAVDKPVPAMSGHSPSAPQQRSWLQWVEAAFPDLEFRAYFLPPVHFNRVPMTRQSIGGQDVQILREVSGQSGQSTPGQADQSTSGQSGQITPEQAGQSTPGEAGQSTPGQSGQITPGQAGQAAPGQTFQTNQQSRKSKGLAGRLGNLFTSFKTKKTKQKSSIQDSDVRDDAALQRILCCLQKMSEANGEVLVGLSQLQFGQYLGEPCYAAAAAQLPVSANLPSVLPEKWKRGDFDVLLIHRHYGLVVCEVKAFCDNIQKLNVAQQDIDNHIRRKLINVVSQLDKAEAMLSHLVSDVISGLRVTKTILGT